MEKIFEQNQVQALSLEEAIRVLYEARRDRVVNPCGKFDNAGRWYPSDEENADGYTDSVRAPSRNWPYSYLVAARTRKHIKALAEVRPDLVIAWAQRALAAPEPTATQSRLKGSWSSS